ncbi:Modification methylase HhaI [Bacillus cereus]|nr:Modification methylase HhaI [Bacillus cereus]
MSFTYVSLFSGIGGFEQGLNRIGGRCLLSSEMDKYANLGYKTLYGRETIGDITLINAEDVPEHDLLVAGFPCQAFSIAGLRRGYEDARGTLFFEVARIANIKKSKVILLENVKGLMSHDKGRTLDVMIQTLNSLGYTIDFNVLNSRYFGVPHNRERIFIVAILNGKTEPWKIEGNNAVAKGKRRIVSYLGVKTFNFNFPEQTEITTKLLDVLEDENDIDEKYYIGGERTDSLVSRIEDDSDKVMIAVREATKKGFAIASIGDSVNIKFPNSTTRRGRVGKGIAQTLEVTMHQATLTSSGRLRKITPREAFRLQGFSDSDFNKLVEAGISDNQLIKMAGNAVTTNVIEHLGKKILEHLKQSEATNVA